MSCAAWPTVGQLAISRSREPILAEGPYDKREDVRQSWSTRLRWSISASCRPLDKIDVVVSSKHRSSSITRLD